jgi:hypothetical protein
MQISVTIVITGHLRMRRHEIDTSRGEDFLPRPRMGEGWGEGNFQAFSAVCFGESLTKADKINAYVPQYNTAIQ